MTTPARPVPPAPAIFFLSDYGTADEFVGVVHAVLHRLAPPVPVIDLSHQVPPFDVTGGAAMLDRCAPYLGSGVVLAVVDPGVGTGRRALALRTAAAGAGAATGPPVPPARPGWWVPTTDCSCPWPRPTAASARPSASTGDGPALGRPPSGDRRPR